MSRFVQVGLIALAPVGFVAALGWLSVRNMGGGGDTTPTGMTADQESALRARGAYLMSIGGGNDCHSPHDLTGEVIPGRELTGHPEGAPGASWEPSMIEKGILFTISPTGTSFGGPHGVSYAANLTPDKETGIGNLTAEGLIRSWRTGRHWKENRPILPLMPYESFANMTDEDIKALHAFLMSVPATKNRVPGAKVNPPPPVKG